MTDLGELEGLTSEHKRALHTVKIASVEELWARVYDNGLDALAHDYKVPRDHLSGLLRTCLSATAIPSPSAQADISSLDALWEAIVLTEAERLADELNTSVEELNGLLGEPVARVQRSKQVEKSLLLDKVHVEFDAGSTCAALAAAGIHTVGDLRAATERLGARALAHTARLADATLPVVLATNTAQRVAAVQYEAVSRVDDALHGVGPHGSRLRQIGVETVGELRRRLAESGLDRLSRQSGIARSVMVNLLGQLGEREARRSRQRWYQRRQIHMGAAIAAIVVSISILAAVVRGPQVWSGVLGTQAVVAAGDLEVGQMLRAENVLLISGSSADPTFVEPQDVEGLVVKQRITNRSPVRQQDVLRYQVVATRDVPAGAVIAPEMVELGWSTYDPRALLRLDQAVGMRAALAFKMGGVVVDSAINVNGPNQTFVQQVIVARGVRVGRFHVMRPEDLVVLSTPRVAGAFASVDQVVGRYTLQSIAPDTPITTDQLSRVALSEPDQRMLSGRQVFALPLAPLADQQALVPPGHYNLALALHDSTQPALPAGADRVSDAIVLSVDTQADGTLLVVAAVTDDTTRALQPRLGTLQIIRVST